MQVPGQEAESQGGRETGCPQRQSLGLAGSHHNGAIGFQQKYCTINEDVVSRQRHRILGARIRSNPQPFPVKVPHIHMDILNGMATA